MGKKSKEWLERGERRIPGGVNSPVRAFRAVGGDPPFIERAESCRLYDVDGNSYIEYVLSWGPMILGHAQPEVVTAVKQAAERGTSFGAPTPLEVELAEEICGLVPGCEKVRLVTSGTEATRSALRLARGKNVDAVVCLGCVIRGGTSHYDHVVSQAVRGIGQVGLETGIPTIFGVITANSLIRNDD